MLSLGLIDNNPFWIFYMSKEPLERLSQLKGKRIAVGPQGSGTRFAAERILGKAGINSETATLLPFGGSAAVDALKQGIVDVVWYNGGPGASAVHELLQNPQVRLMDFPLTDAFTRSFVDVSRFELPQGAISIDPTIPPNDVKLIGTNAKVLIRGDLHPEIVYLLLQAMKEVHAGKEIFQNVGEFPNGGDTEYPVAVERERFLQEWPIVPAAAFAAMAECLRAAGHRGAADCHSGRSAVIRLRAQAVPLARRIPARLHLSEPQGHRGEPANRHRPRGQSRRSRSSSIGSIARSAITGCRCGTRISFSASNPTCIWCACVSARSAPSGDLNAPRIMMNLVRRGADTASCAWLRAAISIKTVRPSQCRRSRNGLCRSRPPLSAGVGRLCHRHFWNRARRAPTMC